METNSQLKAAAAQTVETEAENPVLETSGGEMPIGPEGRDPAKAEPISSDSHEPGRIVQKENRVA